LRYQPHKAPRQVEMTGKVHYAVARDEAHPFRVTAPAATVTVLGTVFQVSEDRVDVTEGRVRSMVP
ncbi:MAG: FecR domain-containing protein, partial [Bacteroidales bacterium]|nr:FecR domain-containing protein [Bacteroidales bacterium]